MKSILIGSLLTLFLTQVCSPQPVSPIASQGGWFWQNPLPQGNTLNDLTFIDLNYGFAVGYMGAIIKTTDGGYNWIILASETVNHLFGVHFTDSNTGTVVGNNGTILRTSDGGETWIPQVSGTTVLLRSVFFSDSEHGTIVGNNGKILHTSDGGNHWISQG